MLVSRRDEEHAQGALSVDLILQRDEIRGKVTQTPLRADGHHSEGGRMKMTTRRGAGNPRGDDTTAPLKSSSDYKPLTQQTFPKHQGAHNIKR